MKVLLVDVPFGAEEIGGEQSNFSGVLNRIPALGLAYLAAVAEQAGHEVEILDCARGLSWDAVTAKGRSFLPDLVGITATTPTFSDTIKAARLLREILPSAVFVLGGPHPTAMPQHAAAAGGFDILVLGEGEDTFGEILSHAAGEGPGKLDEIRGIAFVRDGDVVITPPRPLIEDLDGLPFPARHLLPPLSAYSPTPASYRKLPLAHVMTSRGCPAKCNFCDRAVFGDTYRARSAENVLREVEEVIHVHGAREIRFFDDTFTLNRERLGHICKGMRGFRTPWTCLTRAANVDIDVLRMMREAGCWQVLYGLESGDDHILETLRKNTTVEQNRDAVMWARKAGLRVRADFLVGSPSETVESLEKTLAFAKSLPIDFAHFNKFVPFPGTTFYQQLTEQGYRFDWSGNSSTLDHGALVYRPPAVSEEEYRAFLDRAYREFYLRPKYLVRRVLAMRTLPEFWGNFRGLFAVRAISNA
jgi:radical SAM superfamily enzyme YgiQ (UPF0313 family)